jgi:hypothetical protein
MKRRAALYRPHKLQVDVICVHLRLSAANNVVQLYADNSQKHLLAADKRR